MILQRYKYTIISLQHSWAIPSLLRYYFSLNEEM